MSRIKPKAFWDKQMKEFDKSGMSKREYCLGKGITPRALQYHLNKRNQLTESPKSHNPGEKSKWLPVTVIDDPVYKYSGGVRLQLSKIIIEAEQDCDGVHLAQMLRATGVVC